MENAILAFLLLDDVAVGLAGNSRAVNLTYLYLAQGILGLVAVWLMHCITYIYGNQILH